MKQNFNESKALISKRPVLKSWFILIFKKKYFKYRCDLWSVFFYDLLGEEESARKCLSSFLVQKFGQTNSKILRIPNFKTTFVDYFKLFFIDDVWMYSSNGLLTQSLPDILKAHFLFLTFDWSLYNLLQTFSTFLTLKRCSDLSYKVNVDFISNRSTLKLPFDKK